MDIPKAEDFKGEIDGTGNKDSRDGVQKVRYDLIPEQVITLLAMVYTRGAEKYADNNWWKGLEWSHCYRAALGHIFAFWRGEEFDLGPRGTGLHHLGQAIWNLGALYMYSLSPDHTQFDDRVFMNVHPQHTVEDAPQYKLEPIPGEPGTTILMPPPCQEDVGL